MPHLQCVGKIGRKFVYKLSLSSDNCLPRSSSTTARRSFFFPNMFARNIYIFDSIPQVREFLSWDQIYVLHKEAPFFSYKYNMGFTAKANILRGDLSRWVVVFGGECVVASGRLYVQCVMVNKRQPNQAERIQE